MLTPLSRYSEVLTFAVHGKWTVLITIGCWLNSGCGGNSGRLEVGHEERGILLELQHLLVEERGGIRVDGIEAQRSGSQDSTGVHTLHGILGGSCLAG